MLLLHLHTMYPCVDGFLVTESKLVHQLNARKALLLTDALANGRIPTHLSQKLAVSVVNFDADVERTHCSGTSRVKCMEQLQRFKLLEMLFARAGRSDIALACDTDEIPRPSVVRMLQDCSMFEGPKHASSDASGIAGVGMYVLELARYTYGAHCFLGNDGVLSARAFRYACL